MYMVALVVPEMDSWAGRWGQWGRESTSGLHVRHNKYFCDEQLRSNGNLYEMYLPTVKHKDISCCRSLETPAV